MQLSITSFTQLCLQYGACLIFRTSKSCQLGWYAKSGACPRYTCSSTCSFCQLRSFLLLYCGWPICIYTATASTTRPSCSQQPHPTLFLHPHWSCPLSWRRKSAAECTFHHRRCVEKQFTVESFCIAAAHASLNGCSSYHVQAASCVVWLHTLSLLKACCMLM